MSQFILTPFVQNNMINFTYYSIDFFNSIVINLTSLFILINVFIFNNEIYM